MAAGAETIDTERYARCLRASRIVRWDIDADVIRGRRFDRLDKFLPDGLSLVQDLATLSEWERRYVSQIQGRTYANMFGLVERFINANVLTVSRDHWFGDQVALEALVQVSAEELKHQALFRRIDELLEDILPDGYRFAAVPDRVAGAVLGKSTWSVLALTLHIELFTQRHFRESIALDLELSELFGDVFLFHWKEEAQHAILDELEWRRCDAGLTAEDRDRAVGDTIALFRTLDDVLQAQAAADTDYFARTCRRGVAAAEARAIEAGFLKAYRWQYIHSGAEHPRFASVLGDLTTTSQAERIDLALSALR